MTNKELLDFLKVTDLIRFDMNTVNKEVLENYLRYDNVWRLNKTVKYAKEICKICGLGNEYISLLIELEIKNVSPIYVKTIYKTITLKDLDKYNVRDSISVSMKKMIRNKLVDKDKLYEIGVYLNFYWMKIVEDLLGVKTTIVNYLDHVDSTYLFRLSDDSFVKLNKSIVKYDKDKKEMRDTREKVEKFKSIEGIDWSKIKGIDIQDYDIIF